MEQGFDGFLAYGASLVGTVVTALPVALTDVLFLWVLLATLAIFMRAFGMSLYPRVSGSQRRVWVLAVLPLFSVFYLFWGSHHAVDWMNGEPDKPEWISQVVTFSLPILIAILLSLIVWLKGARVFAIKYGLANLWLACVASIMSLILIAGTGP